MPAAGKYSSGQFGQFNCIIQLCGQMPADGEYSRGAAQRAPRALVLRRGNHQTEEEEEEVRRTVQEGMVTIL
ncbi:hypothetical protein ACOMHN_050529 [Nucella lapillus]